jgi:hypothetical protein
MDGEITERAQAIVGVLRNRAGESVVTRRAPTDVAAITAPLRRIT